MKQKKISIIILTINGDKTISAVLEQIAIQKTRPFEVIVIDSDSKDNTISLVQKYDCKIIKIKRHEFGHGKTRNYGAKIAKGNIIVYVTQDAIPKDEFWLGNLVEKIGQDNIIATFGRQIPRKEADVLEEFSTTIAYPAKDRIWNKNNWTDCPNIFSDSNSAILKSILIKNPFANVLVSEDHEWARRMLVKGYQINYTTKAAVYHSHDYNLSQSFRRFFDIGAAEEEIRHLKNDKPTMNTAKYLNMQIRYLKTKKKMYFIPKAILFNFTKFIGLQLGRHHKILPKILKRSMSDYKNWW